MEIPLTEKELKGLKSWFAKYVKSFQHADPEIQQNITLKEDHTHRVCEAIVDIGVALGLDHDALRLAEAIALLHDIGRFEQFTRYRTFMDAKSENHAELGVTIIEREDILASLNPAAQYIIKQSVRYHNRPSLPLNESQSCLFYARLIRDADKLDIWKVVTDYYHRKHKRKNGAIELELPDSIGFSDEVFRSLTNMHPVNIHDVKNVNDFKLLQVSWVFDLNFRPTMDFLRERQYLELIRQVLPESEKINDIFKVIVTYEKSFCP
ncbi:MAG: HD domain-containing protein [Bacteroidales bacterium]|nr:HD domain-containing protein [Bacteroidales bacterium]